jgi:hypothetical protein
LIRIKAAGSMNEVPPAPAVAGPDREIVLSFERLI